MKLKSGNVVFVGAGPGDPGLITVAGVDALRQATVVLHDYLVHPDLLAHCPDSALRMPVGKSRGHHSKRQEEINALLVEWAKKGHCVVRLKGGDPVIFGRLGEEMETLRVHQIPYRVIPGVSSASAAPIYSGIPLTYREISRSVAFVTASTFSSLEDLTDIHIPNSDTIVFLMPLTHLELLTDRIVQSGVFNKDTPAAMISDGTTPAQKSVFGTLGAIAGKVREAKLPSPALLVVGEVCRFGPDLSWFAGVAGHTSPFIHTQPERNHD